MNKILSKTPGLTKVIQYSLPVFIIGIISRTFPFISSLYYIVPILLVVYTIIGLFVLHRSDVKLRTIIVAFSFPLYCLISSVWSVYPFITLVRSLYLILMYAGILSAVFILIKYYPNKGIDYLLPANILVLIISFISLILIIPKNSWSGGNGLGFMGFAGHQNTLASALLFTLPGTLDWGLEQGAKNKENCKNYYFILTSIFLLLTSNLLFLLLTYSRASILSLAVGFITFMIITKSRKILSVVFSLIAVTLVLYFTIQPINHTLNKWINKDGGNILDRRIILWEPSFEAAKLGGVFGLGYGVSAPDIKTPLLTGSHHEDGRYIREKGNSVLAIIEESGYIGLILFLLPAFYIALKSFTIQHSQRTNHSSLLTAVFASILVHAQFEAWWVGPGSIQFPVYLIILFIAFVQIRSK